MNESKTEKRLPQARAFTVHLIGHAHLDLAYRWRWSESVHYAAVDTFEGVLRQMEQVPGLTFCQSQLALYEAVEKIHPELFSRIKERIREGTWAVVGGMWAEPDVNMPSGEALVRQLLVGKRYARNRLGVDTKVAWLPDVFGHNAHLPQILNRAGMRYYVAGRCMPEEAPVFWWEAPDGSRVLAYRFPDGYSGAIRADLGERIVEWGRHTPIRDVLFLYGAGDHGGGPRDEDLKGIAQLKASDDAPTLVFDTPDAYFERLEKELDPDAIPVVRGELNFFARGCYTTQARVKRLNRLGENLLPTAEKFGANALFIHRKAAFQRYEMLEAWKLLLRMQFHDNLPGTSIGPVYKDNEADFAALHTKASAILREALSVIGARQDTRGEGTPVMVYNPLAWRRSEPVEAEVALRGAPEAVVVVDHEGRALHTQILDRSPQANGWTRLRVLFLASEVPSLGYRLFRVVPGASPKISGDLGAEGTLLENEFLTVEVDSVTGQICRIFDKRAPREVLSAPAGLRIIPEHRLNTAWTIKLLDESKLPALACPVEIVERGPVRATIRVTTVWEDSTFVQDISLNAGVPTVHCALKAEWRESDTCLKVAFPLTGSSHEAAFEVPFGHVMRPTNGDEVPALKWIDLSLRSRQALSTPIKASLSEANYGASLLNNGRYGFDVKDNVLRMSLLRGAVDMDPRADDGAHQVDFALYPHAGDWREARTLRRANELNVPLIAVAERKHEGSAMGWGVPPEEPLPPVFSFLEIAPDNLMVTAMKPVEERFSASDLVLRFYETAGKAVTAEITCPVPLAEAYECDFMEEPLAENHAEIDENRIRVPVGAYEVKTLYLRYSKRFAGSLPQGWEGIEIEA